MKKLLSLILSVSLAISVVIMPTAVSADYEYTWSFAKHGFEETMLGGVSAYKATTIDFTLDLTTDDNGCKIPAKDIKYMQLTYYHYVPDGVTAKMTGTTVYTQTNANAYTGVKSDGTSGTPTNVGGFMGLGNIGTENAWTTNAACRMGNIETAVKNNSAYSKMYLKNLSFKLFNGSFADGECVYLKDIKIYSVAPTGQSAANSTQHKVTLWLDDSKTVKESEGTYGSNISEYADKITLSAPTDSKDGFAFIGWAKTGTNVVYPAGTVYTFTDGADIEFYGVWAADEVYVSADGDDTKFGTNDAPVKTLTRAAELIGADRDGTIHVTGAVDYTEIPQHTGTITIDGGTINSNSAIKLTGKTIFKDTVVNAEVFTYANETKTQNASITSVSLGGDMSIGGDGNAPRDEKAVINGGTYENLYFGGLDESYAYGTYSGANTVYVEGNAVIRNVYLSHGGNEGKKDNEQLWKGDVSLIVNSGTVSAFTQKSVGWLAGGLQVLANYASSVSLPEITTERISFGKWYMYSSAEGGLDITADEGRFTVNDGMGAAAVNRDTKKVYYSDKGILTVPEGVYDVTYTETPVIEYNADNTQISVNSAFEFDTETLDYAKKDGMLFIGWTYSDGSAPKNGETVPAGKTLTAQYTDFDKNSGGDFYAGDAEIRQSSDAEKPALRFPVYVGKNISLPDSSPVYGTVSLPKVVVKYHELETDARYEYPYGSGNMHTAVNTPAALYTEKANGMLYTLCLTDIPAEEYTRDITVRGYVKFTDYNGTERTEYTDKVSANLYELAKKADNTELMNAARTAHDSYGTSEKPYDSAYSSAERGEKAYIDNYSGTWFMESTIDLGLVSAGKITKPLEVISFGDQHFNYADDIDKENPEIMYAKYRRGYGVNPVDKHYQSVQTMMEYASMADYTIFTGDTIDFYMHGSLDLAKETMWDKSPQSMTALGYHDYVVYTINGRSSKEFDQTAARNVLKQYMNTNGEIWTPEGKNITYARYDVPGTPLRFIYLDDSRNGQLYYSEGIQDYLAADIADAKANGKYIFLMKHENTCNNDASSEAVHEFSGGTYDAIGNYVPFANSDGSGKKSIDSKTSGGDVWFNMKAGTESYDQVKGTRAVYELIFHNADVIAGVLHGHVHANYITTIKADYTDAEGNVVARDIPQYCSVLTGGEPYSMGIKLIIK